MTRHFTPTRRLLNALLRPSLVFGLFTILAYPVPSPASKQTSPSPLTPKGGKSSATSPRLWLEFKSGTEYIDRLYAIVQWRMVHLKIQEQAQQHQKAKAAEGKRTEKEKALWLGILDSIDRQAQQTLDRLDAKIAATRQAIAARQSDKEIQSQELTEHQELLETLRQQKSACAKWKLLSQKKLKDKITAKSRYLDDVTRLLGQLRSEERALSIRLEKLETEAAKDPKTRAAIRRFSDQKEKAHKVIDDAQERSRRRLELLDKSYSDAIALLKTQDVVTWSTVLRKRCKTTLEECTTASIIGLQKKINKSGHAEEMPDCTLLTSKTTLDTTITPLIVARCRYQYRKATKKRKLLKLSKTKSKSPSDQLHDVLASQFFIYSKERSPHPVNSAWVTSFDDYLQQDIKLESPPTTKKPQAATKSKEPETVRKKLDDFLESD